MVSALQAAQVARASLPPLVLAGMAMAAATALTVSDLSIVDTMVSVNVVYIASVGTSLCASLRRKRERAVDESWVIAAGFVASLIVYAATWLGWRLANVELLALVAGSTSAVLTRLALHRPHQDATHRTMRG
jgi:SSS family solute:Na+ symporter